MSDKIKRYDLDIKVNIDIQDGELTAPPTASKTEVESPHGRFCLSTDVAAIQAENERLIKTLGSPLRFHCCTEGRIRPYPASICSVAPHDESCSFDPVSEITRLRRIVEAGDKMWEAIIGAAGGLKRIEVAHAYDAAKAQATQQGEKK